MLINPSSQVKAGPYMVEVILVNQLTRLTRKYQLQIEVIGDGIPIQEDRRGSSNPIPNSPEEDENTEGSDQNKIHPNEWDVVMPVGIIEDIDDQGVV